jgi:4-hydroxy-2-oxoheptanedioate aldolase
MKKNLVKEKLAAGQPSVGAWLSLGSPWIAEIMAHMGFDWLVVDTEHGLSGFETTLHCFQAICTSDTMPMARVAWNDPALIKRLLDGGAMGLVIPMVNSPEDAERAVTAMKYPPEGNRSIAGGRAMIYGADYMEWANREVMTIVQIEHHEAVKRAEDILTVAGVDVGFVGPMDLAASLGIPPGKHAGNPKNEEAIQAVVESGKKLGKPLGIYAFSAEDVNRRVEQGFQFVVLSNDKAMLQTQVKQELSRLSFAAGRR